jgi:hypothetical protein
MNGSRELRLDPKEADWKSLDAVLSEISEKSPGARLEHTLGEEETAEGEVWKGEPVRKILPVERWLAIVQEDIERAPTEEARHIITGPYYFWDYDDLGRVLVAANDSGEIVPMFVEVWAGEPD